MKPLIEEPYKAVMRFFTPELYIRFNSADDMEADQANQEWEQAIQAYRRHLNPIRKQMPSSLKQLSALCLHDAEFVKFDLIEKSGFTILPGPWKDEVAILSLRQENQGIILFYLLWGQVRKYAAIKPWPFSNARIDWLYEEIELVPDSYRRFLHRILLSDGTVLEIPFVSAIVHRLPTGVTDQVGPSKIGA